MQKIVSKITRTSVIISSVIILSSFTIFKYVFDKNDVIFELLFGSLNQNHYSPLKIDDSFSEKVFELYVKRLDYNKKFLLQEDFDDLAKSRRDIDDQLLNQRHDFYTKSINIYSTRLKEKENWCKELLAKPFDYTLNEEYETDYEKTTYSKTQADLKNEWRKMIKYQVL